MPVPNSKKQATIARIWRGRTTRANADRYGAYLSDAGVKPLEAVALGIEIFREDREHDSEFMVVSYWEDAAAMSRYAGPVASQIRHADRDAELLIELPSAVQVLSIVRSSRGGA